MKVIIIDAVEFTSKATAHEYIANLLDFPAYYGKNLDALADCLAELPRDIAVIFKNISDAGETARAIWRVFDEILSKEFRVVYIGGNKFEFGAAEPSKGCRGAD